MPPRRIGAAISSDRTLVSSDHLPGFGGARIDSRLEWKVDSQSGQSAAIASAGYRNRTVLRKSAQILRFVHGSPVVCRRAIALWSVVRFLIIMLAISAPQLHNDCTIINAVISVNCLRCEPVHFYFGVAKVVIARRKERPQELPLKTWDSSLRLLCVLRLLQ
jgi:hypothetical protein